MKSARAVRERFFGIEEWVEKIRSQPQTIYSKVPLDISKNLPDFKCNFRKSRPGPHFFFPAALQRAEVFQ